MKPLTIETAARIMGVHPETVRIGLQRGLFPFGAAFKRNPEGKHYTYTIYPEKFRACYGPTQEEATP